MFSSALMNLSAASALFFASSGFSKSTDPAATKTHFGEPFQLKEAKALHEILEKPEAYAKEERLLTEATVDKVCEKKGCWMTLKDGAHSVRVTFKNYGFFVPAKLIGTKVKAEGQLVQKTLSEAEVRHLAEDGGEKLPKDKQVKPQTVWQFVASGVDTSSSSGEGQKR